jgi:hypothetical protein
MKQAVKKISNLSFDGLKVQGYVCPANQLAEYRLGIRFAYGTCASVILIGLIFQNAYFYYAGLVISFGGMFPPRHPVDYIYNGVIRHLFKKPAIPKRPPQSRFACSIAFVWIAAFLLCWHRGYFWISSALAGALIMQAGIVTFTDICFPSMIYNFFSNKNVVQNTKPSVG